MSVPVQNTMGVLVYNLQTFKFYSHVMCIPLLCVNNSERLIIDFPTQVSIEVIIMLGILLFVQYVYCFVHNCTSTL